MNTFRSATQSLLVCVHRDLRNIENCYVRVSMRQQVIDECGFAAAYIDDCRTSGSDPFDEGERSLKMRSVPTHRVRRFLGVDLLPVSMRVHSSYLLSSGVCLT